MSDRMPPPKLNRNASIQISNITSPHGGFHSMNDNGLTGFLFNNAIFKLFLNYLRVI